MAFKKRKVDRRKLDAPIFSGAAEVCETRALLSADGVCLPAVDADAVVIEDIEATDSEEIVDVEATLEDGEFIPELAICTMLPVIDGEVVEDLGGGDENEVVDPSLMFYSFMPFDSDVDQGLIACDDYPVFKGDVTESEDGVVDIADEFVDPSLMFCNLMPYEGGDPEVAVCDGLVIEEEPVFKGDGEEVGIVDGEEPVEVTFEDFDPSWVIRSFGAPSGEVVDDLAFTCGIVDDEVALNDVVDEEFVDVTTLDGYDPSWAYRTFTSGVPEGGEEGVEDVTDGEVKVQFWHDLAPGSEEDVVVDETEEDVDITTLEDYDPSWAYRGGIADSGVEDESSEDVEGEVEDGVVEKEVDEEVVLEDGEVPVRYYFGMNFRGNTGGEIPVDVLAMSSGAPSGDATPSVMGPVAISTPAVAPVANIPVVVNQPSVIPTVVSPSLSIPVNQGGFSSFFGKEEELLVTTLAPAVSEIEPLVSDVEDSVSSGLDSGFGDLIGSISDSSDSSVGELTPIFEDEQNEEESVEVPAAEEVPVETEESVSSVDVPQQPVMVASRASYGRSIDEFMSEFAMSGFAG